MKLNKVLIPAVVLVFAFSLNILAQKSTFIRANELYDAMAYASAAQRFEKVLNKDSSNNEAWIKLADCYRKQNLIKKAAATYKIIVDKGIAQPIQKLYYAQALMETGNYGEAKKYMAEYQADSRGETFLKAMNDLDKFFTDTAYYKVTSLPFNSELNDFAPRILNDKIVFVSSRNKAHLENHINTWNNEEFFKLYFTRKKSNGKYASVRSFPHAIDNRFNAGPVSFSKQSNTVYLSRNNVVDTKLVRAEDGQVKMQLYAGSLNKKGTAYQYLLDFKYNNKEFNFTHPAISDDGKWFYFVSDMPAGAGGNDIWMCTREGDSWTIPKNLGTRVNTAGDEAFPYVNGNKLYFSSNGLEGIGGLDIFSVNLDNKGLPAGNPKNIGAPLNSMADDFGIDFYPEGKKGVFSSNRTNYDLNDDIFEFTSVAPEKLPYQFLVMDNETRQLLASSLEITDGKTGEKSELNENEGKFVTDFLPGHQLSIIAKSDGYITKNDIEFNTPANNSQAFEILLNKKNQFFIAGTVFEKTGDNLSVMDSVLIEIMDNSDHVVYSCNTGDTAVYHSPDLLPDTPYKVAASKKGYIPKYETVSSITPGGSIIDFNLSKITIGASVRIDNIYFDFDKSNIRPDAAKELDKLVVFLKENPGIIVEMSSHTDCRGSEEYNNKLSERRARSSANYIISKGIDPKRISSKGYGESRLLNNCNCSSTNTGSKCTEPEHQLNRRTEFVIKGIDKK